MDSIAQVLADLARLHSDGRLTDIEYAAAKRAAINESATPPNQGAAEAPSIPTQPGTPDLVPPDSRPWNWRRISNFTSRTRRSEFWAAVAIAMGASFSLGFIDGLVFGETVGVFYLASIVVVVWLVWGASVNRLHDMGRSGWFVLLYLVPLVNLGLLIWVGAGEGEAHSNQWGQPIGSATTRNEAPVPTPSTATPASAGLYAHGQLPTDGGSNVSDESSNQVKWLGGLAVVAFVIAAVLGIYLLSTNGGNETAEAISVTTSVAVSPTTTAPTGTTTTTSATTTTTPAPSAVTLKEFNGTWTHEGSVASTPPGSRLEYLEEAGDLYLSVDGVSGYNVQTWACRTSECKIGLTLAINTPGEMVWVMDYRQADGGYKFSDLLLHSTNTETENVSACWSPKHDGPIVAVTIGSRVVQAWVLTDEGGGETWLGTNASTIDGGQMLLAREFGERTLPTC